jgi:rare lipoprotein A
MARITQRHGVLVALSAQIVVFCAVGMPVTPGPSAAGDALSAHTNAGGAAQLAGQPQPDLSGRERTGIASFYADRFAGRKMADGARMNPQGNNAASRTLPLGTVAKVTDLATRKSAVVTIEDRGPYVQGRIVDLSPATARQIGITPKAGIAEVRVTPIAVPLPGGRILLARASPPQATRPSEQLQ